MNGGVMHRRLCCGWLIPVSFNNKVAPSTQLTFPISTLPLLLFELSRYARLP